LSFKGYGISLPKSSSNIQRQSLQCFGGETNVMECTSETVQCLRVGIRGVCELWPQGVLGLYCNDYNIENIRLQLLLPYEGSFEVLVDGEWGSPSAELGLIEAQIICKHFGFINAKNTFTLTEPSHSYKSKINGIFRCTGHESSPFECAFQHQGYLGVTDIGFTLVNCSRECNKDRYGFGTCDHDCLCISANTVNCDDVSGECTCMLGWTGTYCETDINECPTQNICPDGTDCVNHNGSYECTCRPGTMVSDDLSRCIDCPRQFFGWNCVSSCQCSLQNILTNGRDCDSVTGKCHCSHGWAGKLCDTDIDECLNRSLCSDVNTECRNEDGGFKCDCVEGYARDNNNTCFAIKVEEKDSSNTLLIAINSSVVAVLLMCVLVGVCCYVNRKQQNGRPNTLASNFPIPQGIKDVLRSSTALENPLENQESSYCTINDAANYERLQKLPTPNADYKTIQCHNVNRGGYLEPRGKLFLDTDGYLKPNGKRY
ncbi:MEG10-like protein, partial [Mya arenaria]